MQMSLEVSAGVLATLRLNEDKMRAALSTEMLATDLAEYLVRKVSGRDQVRSARVRVSLARERKMV